VKLVLASGSPRRADLLARAGYEFTVDAPDLDEDALFTEVSSPSRRAILIALEKARAIAGRHPDAFVLGADTLVILGSEVLGKPRDADHALWMLSRLSGVSHEVVTGVALIGPDEAGLRGERTGFGASRVTFGRWPSAALLAYARSGAPLDKAGGYGIQEAAGAYVTDLAGCYFNVVGLPLSLVVRLLAEAEAAED
jgi:nucleoside triphosphate pyrophosphatase